MAESQTKTAPVGSSSIAELFGRFAPESIRYATAMLRNESDAEDIVQDAFLRLTRRIDGRMEDKGIGEQTEPERVEAESENRFKATLFTVVRNLCIDKIRKNKRHKTIPFTQFHEMTTATNAVGSRDNGDANRSTLQEVVSCLMHQMKPAWSEALKLKINGQLSYEQIAMVMSESDNPVTHAQVRTWIFRGRRFLESELNRMGMIGERP